MNQGRIMPQEPAQGHHCLDDICTDTHTTEMFSRTTSAIFARCLCCNLFRYQWVFTYWKLEVSSFNF